MMHLPRALRGGRALLGIGLFSLITQAAVAQPAFVNWENPPVSPLSVTPDGLTLLAANLPDDRLEVFDISSGTAIQLLSIPVGVDPVSVRARTDTEAWVVNHISDSISIVDLITGHVVATLNTDDEPADVVFAGQPQRAFVSCSQANTVLVFNPDDLSVAPQRLTIQGEDPRAMAVSSNEDEVYVAIFESGNRSTILGGGGMTDGGFPPNVVNDPSGPYAGQNPPPNDGANFNPPLADFNNDGTPGTPAPPAVGLIVKKTASGRWMDDNNGDWTDLVSGTNATLSGRPEGWDLLDHDVAIIDANSLSVRYARHAMNLCMALAVNPANNQVTVVGTDATNEIRFEPVLRGRFLRVNFAAIDPAVAPADPLGVIDLNPHLIYTEGIPFVPIPQGERDQSLGDPRGIVWQSDGTRGYVSGMGSNNVIAIEASGQRVAGLNPIQVGEGPTGLVMDESRDRLYVLNRFGDSISVVDTRAHTAIDEVPMHDPTPPVIRLGRKHLYDTHRNSGLGHTACASCHVDARTDRLAWDLGDPSGTIKAFNQNCPDGGCEDWHPMKGPMSTQALQDIIGLEPFHWRGDREGLEAFAAAFHDLQGDDQGLPAPAMQEFEDFLATIHFPPNPYRKFDNTLPADLPLPGHFTSGTFGPAGQPLPNGNAQSGLLNFRTGALDNGLQCVTCHTLPTGTGPDGTIAGFPPIFQPIPPGPLGEHHLATVSVDGSTNITIKIPQLRNMYEKVGFEMTQSTNTAGFGFLHDGSVDSLARFVTEPLFSLSSDQEVADMVAFLLAFAGSDLPTGSPTNPFELPGVDSQDTHAAVGVQVTVDAANKNAADVIGLLGDMQLLADDEAVALIAKGRQDGLLRGYAYIGAGLMQSDRAAETISVTALRAAADTGSEITFTVVPFGTQTRAGIDRDSDGHFDQDERDACSDPANSLSVPGDAVAADLDCDADVDADDFDLFAMCQTGPMIEATMECLDRDFDGDNDVDQKDFARFQRCLTGPGVPPDPTCQE